jgi:hypothetical protein
MNRRKTIALAVLGVAAIALPGAAAAKPGKGKAKGHGKSHGVAYVFKGTYGGDGLVAVKKGNRHARKAGLVGVDVQFDLSGAKLTVADTNADDAIDTSDLVAGDNVVVKAKLPKHDPGAAPYAAKRLVDQTNPADDDADEDEDDEAEEPDED